MTTGTTISYEQTEEFQKDFKKLLKKYRSLEEDLELVKRAAIELFHLQRINNLSVFPIPGFCSEEILVCKIKKFACRALKGRGSKSGIRVIYAFHINILRVVFITALPKPRTLVRAMKAKQGFKLPRKLIEIYFKADQENEDRERIQKYLNNLSAFAENHGRPPAKDWHCRAGKTVNECEDFLLRQDFALPKQAEKHSALSSCRRDTTGVNPWSFIKFLERGNSIF